MSRPRRPSRTSNKNEASIISGSMLGTLKDYFRLLFDLSFNQYLTLKMLPIFYVIIVIAGMGVIGQLVWDAYGHSTWRGMLYTLASPMAALFWVSACRATTEFLLAVFRMSGNVQRLAQITDTVDRLEKAVMPASWLGKLVNTSAQVMNSTQQKTPTTPAIHPEKKP